MAVKFHAVPRGLAALFIGAGIAQYFVGFTQDFVALGLPRTLRARLWAWVPGQGQHIVDGLGRVVLVVLIAPRVGLSSVAATVGDGS